jgi:DNA replication and repair protein RecF
LLLERLRIERYRNLGKEEISFSKGLNFLLGPNGAGKSSVLEAFYLVCTARPLSSGRLERFVQHGQPGFSLFARIMGGPDHHSVLADKKKTKALKIYLDDKPIERNSALFRIFPVQSILPNAADLLLGPPSLRRSQLDWVLFHVEPDFLVLAHQYKRALKQRNAWLRSSQLAENGPDPWADALVTAGAAIEARRCAAIDVIEPIFSEIVRGVDERLDCAVAYRDGGMLGREEGLASLAGRRSSDRLIGATVIGPQRADLLFRNGQVPCSEALSRGQVKTVSACWALACSVFLGRKMGRQPALLFDEIGADWDSSTLFNFISRAAQFGGQVVGTSSNWEYNGWEQASKRHNAALFHVEQGKIGVRSDSAIQGA